MKSALDFEQAKIIEISTENQRKKFTINLWNIYFILIHFKTILNNPWALSLIGKDINQHNTLIIETAFGDEQAHAYDSLASVLARPRMSKRY